MRLTLGAPPAILLYFWGPRVRKRRWILSKQMLFILKQCKGHAAWQGLGLVLWALMEKEKALIIATAHVSLEAS